VRSGSRLGQLPARTYSKIVSKFCLASGRMSRHDSASAKWPCTLWTESPCFAGPVISTVTSKCNCRLYDSLALKCSGSTQPCTHRAHATVPANASSLSSARIWTLGVERATRFLFQLTAREDYACAETAVGATVSQTETALAACRVPLPLSGRTGSPRGRWIPALQSAK
jgi:hypothetical protein